MREGSRTGECPSPGGLRRRERHVLVRNREAITGDGMNEEAGQGRARVFCADPHDETSRIPLLNM